MPPLRALAVGAVLLLCTACTIGSEGNEPIAPPPAAARVTVHCAETSATPLDGRPAVLADTTSAWFGQSDLWVGLPDYPAVEQGDSLALKVPWVTLADGATTSALGPPTVTATRSDAPGDATGQLGGAARAFGTGDLSFWPATVTFPAPGCWTVTGVLGATVLQFVVKVQGP
jgi:hypothetical protein